MKCAICLTALLLLTCFAACTPNTTAEATDGTGLEAWFEHDELVVEDSDGRRHTLDIYLALDVEQQRRGLMFVRKMPRNTGMLFVYDGADVRSMWMKNTFLSLDIVFARADGRVSSVIRDTTPQLLTPLRSIEPVVYVLELNAGTARRLNIGPGSRLIWDSNDADHNTVAIESAR